MFSLHNPIETSPIYQWVGFMSSIEISNGQIFLKLLSNKTVYQHAMHRHEKLTAFCVYRSLEVLQGKKPLEVEKYERGAQHFIMTIKDLYFIR